MASRDYYDFINLVREDWGSNFTVLGAWAFFSPDAILAMPVEEIREQYRRQGIRYACSYGGWVDAKLVIATLGIRHRRYSTTTGPISAAG